MAIRKVRRMNKNKNSLFLLNLLVWIVLLPIMVVLDLAKLKK